MLNTLKASLIHFSPKWLLRIKSDIVLKYQLFAHDRAFKDSPLVDIFSLIYSEKMWGNSNDGYCSGHGSHLNTYVDPYVNTVSSFLSMLPPPITVVDLGCGDFNIGSKICHIPAKYIACDIVPSLIERNSVVFQSLGVDFRVLNLITDNLPDGDIAIIRQVLQHLSNEDIAAIVEKLYKYRFVLVAELIPLGNFIPNINQPTGSFSRLARGIHSGVDLLKNPFCLKIKSSTILCETIENGSNLRVVLYEL